MAMEQRRQAVLLNYALALEDSVILEKIWPQMEDVFDENEKRDILGAGGNKKKMRRMLEILPEKNDAAFTSLVTALKPDYRWLSFRIDQGVYEEEDRLTRAGKGIKRKVTVALMRTRISDRQRDMVIDSVSDTIEEELRDRTLRVDIPDHKAASNLNDLNNRLRELVNLRIDPLLHGSSKTDLSQAENEALADKLEQMLGEMSVIEDCYKSMEVDQMSATPRSLPTLLYQKIDEVKTRIGILEDDQERYRLEREEILRERNENGKSLSELESANNNLEFENRKLREEVITLEQGFERLTADKRDLTNERRRFEDDQIRLSNQMRQLEDESTYTATRNKRLEEINAKLSRDVQRLTTSNAKLRKDTRNSSLGDSARLRQDKKRLTEERSRLQTEVRRQENEKRQILVRNQRLEAENQNLKDQKKRLYEEKTRFLEENKSLKLDSRRFAIGSNDRHYFSGGGGGGSSNREYRHGNVNYTRRAKYVEISADDRPGGGDRRRGSVRSTSMSTSKPRTNETLPSSSGTRRRSNVPPPAKTTNHMFKNYPTAAKTKNSAANQSQAIEPAPPKGSKPNNYDKHARKSVTFRG